MKIDFRSRYLNVLTNDFLFELWGNIWGHKHWGFEIWKNSNDEKSFRFETIHNRRVFAHQQFILNISFNNYNFIFSINDDREWDCHTDKFITWNEYCKLPEKREGKTKFKFRKWGMQKWYFLSKYLKIYNLDVLNNPYGITIEFTHFPHLFCVILQFGKNQECSSGLRINFIKYPKEFNCNFEISLLGWFLGFNFKKNKFNVLTQIVGKDKLFKYYTMEDEVECIAPHVHVCVDLDNSKWNGEIFKNFQSLKTIATIKLLNKCVFYTCENIEFCEIFDLKIYNYKQQFCDWLNSQNSDLLRITNS